MSYQVEWLERKTRTKPARWVPVPWSRSDTREAAEHEAVVALQRLGTGANPKRVRIVETTTEENDR